MQVSSLSNSYREQTVDEERRVISMIRDMVRKKQLLSKEECEEILRRNTNGVMAVMGDEGYPYGVPLSFVYHNGKIYFHSAKHGYKVECIARSPKVSFTVVDKDEIVAEEYTSYFRSAIAMGNRAAYRRGRASGRLHGFDGEIFRKYAGRSEEKRSRRAVNGRRSMPSISEHLTGKEAIELVRKKAGIEKRPVRYGQKGFRGERHCMEDGISLCFFVGIRFLHTFYRRYFSCAASI